MIKIFVFTVLFILLCTHKAVAANSNYDNDISEQRWMSREYDKFIINYPSFAEESVDVYAKWYQHFFPKYQSFFNWTPKNKFQVSLFPQFDLFNGFSTSLPYNQNGLYLTVYDQLGSLTDRQSQIRGLVNHELVHLFHIDKNSGYSQKLRNVFGRIIVTFPALFQPRLFIEGLAVYFETEQARGFGRGANSWFPARMRMEVLKGLPPKINPLLNFSHSVPRDSVYLYGYYFIAFLFETYGEKAVQRWINEFSNNVIPFRIDSNAKYLGGYDLEYEWAQFTVWLEKKFSAQIEQIRRQKKLSQIATLESSHSEVYNQPFFLNANEVIYFQDNGRESPSLIKYNLISKKQEKWFSFDGAASVFINPVRYDFHPKHGLLFTQLGRCVDDGLRFDLYHLDTKSKVVKQLTQCQSIRRAIWDDKGGIVAVQSNRASLHHATTSVAESHKLVYFDHKNENYAAQSLMVVPFDSVVESLDIANDKLVLSLKKAPQGFNLYQAKLDYSAQTSIPKLAELKPLIENNNQNLRVRFDQSNQLHYISDAGGVYNLYRYDDATQKSVQLTHVIGGIVDYDVGSDNQVIVSQFSTLGFNSAYLAKPSISKSAQASPSSVPLDIAHQAELDKQKLNVISDKKYSPFNTLAPTGWFPIWFSQRDGGSQFGLVTNGQDAVRLQSYQLSTGLYQYQNYSNLFLNMQYVYDKRWSLIVKQTPFLIKDETNDSDDNDGDVRSQIRLDQSVNLAYSVPWTAKINQRFGLSNRQFSYINPSDDSQVQLSKNQYNTYLGSSVQYKDTRQWIKQMQPHQGIDLRVGMDSLIEHSNRNKSQLLALNLRYFYPLQKHSIFTIFDLANDLQKSNTLIISESFTIPTLTGNRSYQFKGVDDLSTIDANQIQKFHIGWQSPAKVIDYGYYAVPLGIAKLSMQLKTGLAYIQNYDVTKKQTLRNYELNVLADIYIAYFGSLPIIISYAQGSIDKGVDGKKQSDSSFSFSLNFPY